MSRNLVLGDELELNKALIPRSRINIRSAVVDLIPDPTVESDSTVLDFKSDQSISLLRISFRRHAGNVIFISDWPKDEGETIGLDGVFKNKSAIINILDTGDAFNVYVDGTKIHRFKKRYQIEVSKVGYLLDPLDTTSVLANQLTVDVTVDPVPSNYQEAFFPLTAADIAFESQLHPFDVVIVGSGIGGGVLATDLLRKNKILASNSSYFTNESTPKPPGGIIGAPPSDDKSRRILVIERGGVLFQTHPLNMPQPSSRGTYGQMNDFFYNKLKKQFDMDQETAEIWKGGPVYCLGGRSTVWGLFTPRIALDTMVAHFPEDVTNSLTDKYLRRAEELMDLSYPSTLPIHQAVIDKLNTQTQKDLPETQWQWGRIASEFKDNDNYQFAKGAYSTVDKLMEAAMDDPQGESKFKTVLNAHVDRLEPQPLKGKKERVEYVVIKDGDKDYKIKCGTAVLSAGAVESAAILLRSASGASLEDAYGSDFAHNFGHVTDHYIFSVAMPFYYRNMALKDVVGGMKLQTDIKLTAGKDELDDSAPVALANLSLDASSFLPRGSFPHTELPLFIIAYILPSPLSPKNSIVLDQHGNPKIHVGYAEDPGLEHKKKTLIDFAVDVMNKLSQVLDLQFVHVDKKASIYEPLPVITAQHLTLNVLGPGGVAHELGSIPMPNSEGANGLVDSSLQLQYGWDNVYVCDLSVFPYSPAANPTLSLAALALRLSDELVNTENSQPIWVYNLTPSTVWVTMTLSREAEPGLVGPYELVEIKSGRVSLWKRTRRETIFIYGSDSAVRKNFDVQMVYPGVNAMIVHSPPPAL